MAQIDPEDSHICITGRKEEYSKELTIFMGKRAIGDMHILQLMMLVG